MVGFPKRREFFKKIDDEGGIEAICELILEGLTMNEIGDYFGCSAGLIYLWFKRNGPEEREEYRKATDEARAHRAHLVAEGVYRELSEMVDAEDTTMTKVSAMKSKADYSKFLASRWNRRDYGDEKSAVNVNVNTQNFGDDFMKAIGESTKQELGDGVPEADFKVLEPGEE